MDEELKSVLKDMPQLPQRQDCLNDQLRDSIAVLQKCGMYDAADFVKMVLRSK
jgi:hypothetical protein